MNNASIEIEAAPQTIFEYITNPEHLKSWQPDVVEPRPLPPGGLRVGTHVGATVQEYGRRFDVDLLVAAMTRNENIMYRMEAPTVSALVEYRLVTGYWTTAFQLELESLRDPRRTDIRWLKRPT